MSKNLWSRLRLLFTWIINCLTIHYSSSSDNKIAYSHLFLNWCEMQLNCVISSPLKTSNLISDFKREKYFHFSFCLFSPKQCIRLLIDFYKVYWYVSISLFIVVVYYVEVSVLGKLTNTKGSAIGDNEITFCLHCFNVVFFFCSKRLYPTLYVLWISFTTQLANFHNCRRIVVFTIKHCILQKLTPLGFSITVVQTPRNDWHYHFNTLPRFNAQNLFELPVPKF